MDEILALQQQLAAVQLVETVHKLSDRNCVDLVVKLKELGLVEVFYTLNAKEYLTPRQLEREIYDELLAHGGRVTVNDIQAVINVDIVHVERSCENIVRKDGEVSMMAGELITSWYLDSIAEECNELLQERGQLTMGSLAGQFGFSVEFTRDFIAARLGRLIMAQLKQNVLYTDAFVEKQLARIRGVFSAMTRPTSIPHVTVSYEFEDGVVEEALRKMIDDRTLPGTIKGREYVPHLFAISQKNAIVSFFETNRFIDNNRVKKWEVSKPGEFLKQFFPDCIALDTCVVSGNLLSQIEGLIENAIHERSWVDLRQHVPESISNADLSTLINKCKSLKRGRHLHLADVYVVSEGFLDAFFEGAKASATKAADDYAKQRKGNTTLSTTLLTEENQELTITGPPGRSGGREELQDEDWDADRRNKMKRGGKGGKLSGKKGKRQAMSDEEEEETFSQQLTSKKGGKKRANKNGSESEIVSRGGNEVGADFLPGHEEIATLLNSASPELQDHIDLLEELSSRLLPKVADLYSDAAREALSTVLRGDAVAKRKLRAKFEEKFDAQRYEFAMLLKGLQQLRALAPKETDGFESMESHLLDTSGVRLCQLVTSYFCQVHSAPYSQMDKELAGEWDSSIQDSTAEKIEDKLDIGSLHLSMEDKESIEANVPAPAAPALIKLWLSAKGSKQNLKLFVDLLENIAELGNCPPIRMDKKKDRQFAHSFKQRTLSLLQTTDSASEGCRLAATVVLLPLLSSSIISLPPDINAVKAILQSVQVSSVPNTSSQVIRLSTLIVECSADADEQLYVLKSALSSGKVDTKE